MARVAFFPAWEEPSMPYRSRLLLLALLAALLSWPPRWMAAQDDEPLIPDLDRTRRERLAVIEGRFVTPPGFTVEEVATNELVGSVVNMTFDHLGRPALALERKGVVLLLDRDGDGRFDATQNFCDDIQTAHGMHYLGPGDLLVHSEGPRGTGLYRLTDLDGDDRADRVLLMGASRGGIQEHGPHTIMTGPDGLLYVLFGNHAFPDMVIEPGSPSRRLQEDHLLERYVDPRGHAAHIRAPGGTIHRVDLQARSWTQIAGGFRNPFDMAMSASGEVFAYDADMEWDVGLPWYRPTRVVHVIPGGDYGWRTGSSKMPFYYLDTLPSVDDIGRGSPVGVAFYHHRVYPERFRGALFLGDWSRGRVRVLFPRRVGATYLGKSLDFVLGEPLNVTDLDIGPDGFLYFSTGGRMTSGGLYRVRYESPQPASAATPLESVLDQPMPRSAWGKLALSRARDAMGDRWGPSLELAALNMALAPERRLWAIEALQVYGPAPDLRLLRRLARDREPEVRARAALLMGLQPLAEVRRLLADALEDPDPLVARRACEALIQAGLNENQIFDGRDPLPGRLFYLLDHEDRFLRYAARLALMRIDRQVWAGMAAADSLLQRPRGALEGLLALIYTQTLLRESDQIFEILDRFSRQPMPTETLLDYLRLLQLAFTRDLAPRTPGRQGFMFDVGARLLEQFPQADPRLNRELQVVLAYMQTPGVVPALLARLTPDQPQEEQIHTVYCLRSIKTGWTREQRQALVEWFDRGREMAGAASMEGYINNLWEASLALLPENERKTAEERKEKALAERTRRAAELMAEVEGDRPPGRSDLAQMSFQELSEYLEYDIMTYERGNAGRGERVFRRARCADCHVFGTIGRGGGPDLSTVVKRFRRKEILEAIMYPSRVISDQYTGLRVELRNRDVLNGLLAGESADTLTLITPTGERLDLAKVDIVDRRPSDVSIMPEGLLDTMTLGDLVDLVLFLERGADL